MGSAPGTVAVKRPKGRCQVVEEEQVFVTEGPLFIEHREKVHLPEVGGSPAAASGVAENRSRVVGPGGGIHRVGCDATAESEEPFSRAQAGVGGERDGDVCRACAVCFCLFQESKLERSDSCWEVMG